MEETGNKIFENLEQNWEISQAINELLELENQNKETLKSLEKMYLNTESSNYERKEHLQNQMDVLRQTMDNNEIIKNDLKNNLKSNMEQKLSLQNKISEITQDCEFGDEIEFMTKLMNIESLDIAINLAKDKIQKNKQISQMEEEIKLMR
eukprot:CAMPEP_0114580090 /NCGR_PEP_ID=MMETSP0125-20121206/4430_1 /TAXON_ID=485358 ORGANISM="Aristerostoma sp., Strain ATCC 50986" /NCGR_SAMPLE_ID=MMETSP0125 /ASSEMBLY_ACC=CAM_ASM_000245 /LENGTH=149 /DNA_ID=CAMNT_0001771413 /DNA_START=302 /DNA_END=751 /DNA_ORIENTATION=+